MRIGVMGAGAVGMFFAARLARAGADVTVVARPAHVEAVRRDGLLVDSVDGAFTVPLAAADTVSALGDCEVVLVSVKTVDTDATGELLAPVLGRETLVVSVQNGVDNAWRLRARLPQPVVPSVVYVSVEMAGPGRLRHNGGGRLIVGAPLGDAEQQGRAERRLGQLQALLQDAGVPCPRSDDVRVDLWTKLATNCAYNAISALTGRRYGQFVDDPAVRAVMDLAADEIAALAAADGVPVTRDMLGRAIDMIAQKMPQALASTAQDLQAGRRTEIDDLNGFVVRRGAALGVPTPVNQTLRTLVKFVEQARDADRDAPQTK
jgi:2-dehydropantoate 2-reductase